VPLFCVPRSLDKNLAKRMTTALCLENEMSRKNTEKEFWNKVDKQGNDDCWNWKAGKDDHGYGKFKFNGHAYHSHRLSWIFCNGNIPDKLQVLHHCDNPACVNPNHLFLGTPTDNMQDMTKKGRSMYGEKGNNAKLTWDQVQQIRERRKHGEMNCVMALEFKVNRATISRVVTGECWKPEFSPRNRKDR
jgi:hypothetical protein